MGRVPGSLIAGPCKRPQGRLVQAVAEIRPNEASNQRLYPGLGASYDNFHPAKSASLAMGIDHHASPLGNDRLLARPRGRRTTRRPGKDLESPA